MHQIRRHAAMAGVPVLGDLRYGGAAKKLWPRLALHARRLALAHPVSGASLVVESPIPADLAELWEAISGSSR
jgi:23S rRNA-/tRNA-specific pseudouridylate synthase